MNICSETAGPISLSTWNIWQHSPAAQQWLHKQFKLKRGHSDPIKGLVGGRIMNIMTDTGSYVSLLKRILFAMVLGGGRVINHRVTNGMLSEKKVYSAVVTLRIGEREIVHPFLSADTLMVPVILGHDFVTENQWCINFAGNCLRRAPDGLMKEQT
uniref:Peptidase A2 domain-containing protein n=1 Tax=Trichuris muris TaxID=70415 RepID=A0A5S6R0H1_TRIMR